MRYRLAPAGVNGKSFDGVTILRSPVDSRATVVL